MFYNYLVALFICLLFTEMEPTANSLKLCLYKRQLNVHTNNLASHTSVSRRLLFEKVNELKNNTVPAPKT